MRALIKFLLIAAITTANTLALAQGVSSGFNKRDAYLNKTQLGNPSAASKIIDTRADVSHLGNLNDSGLTARGKELLRTSEHGKLLQNAEEKKLNSIQRHKIDPNNGWLKDSLIIEQNPMSKTGGRDLSATEKTTATMLKKSCIEGSDFDVNVGVELVLDAEEEEYLSEEYEHEKTQREVFVPGDVIFHQGGGKTYTIFWKKNRFGLHLHLDQPGWRVFLANYLNIPIDNIGTEINFPDGARGVGSATHRVEGKVIAFDSYRFKYTYRWKKKLKRFVEKGQYWQVATEGMEELAKSNECYETGRVCLKSGVKTFFGKYDVRRECWYEQVRYRCQSEPKNGCAHLTKQNCQLKDSVCQEKVGNLCIKWKRNYVCGARKREMSYSLADSKIYCLGGNCHRPVMEENQDFANVAYLGAVQEASKDCVKGGNGVACKNPITVFPGQKEDCRTIITGFVNCCSSMRGWGTDRKLCKCSGEEKGLSLKREKGLCHKVGTYCSHRDQIFGKCLTKKTNYCCFSSKLARILQEQGRMQLGIGWGSPSSPNCEPLTLEQFSKLDFSKFDMDQLFDALLDKGKSNMNKTFPVLKPGQVPSTQQKHMKTK